MNSPITRLVNSIDSTNAKNPNNQLLIWYYERFNQANIFIAFLSFIIYHRFIKKTALMNGIEYAFLFFTNSGCK